MIVIDTSVWLDLFLEDSYRRNLAENLIKLIEEKKLQIYEPEVFKIELAGVLARKFKREDVLNFIEELLLKVKLVENPNELAFLISLKTGCRAIDSYFIATAKMTDSTLVSNDKIMVKNAKKFGINAYYLLEQQEDILKLIE